MITYPAYNPKRHPNPAFGGEHYRVVVRNGCMSDSSGLPWLAVRKPYFMGPSPVRLTAVSDASQAEYAAREHHFMDSAKTVVVDEDTYERLFGR